MGEVENTRPQWDPLRGPRPQGDEQGVQVVLVRLLVVLVHLLVVMFRPLVVLVRLATGGTSLACAGPPSRTT
jgi:hypothetical protein